MKTIQFIETPLGTVTLVEDEGALCELRFGEQQNDGECLRTTSLLLQAQEELHEYFCGYRKTFTMPLHPEGTPFQQAVWQALLTIPYGQTMTYGDVAAQIGNPKACRAVGMANNKNPLPILIPCHRVIGTGGKLVGYGGGLDIKEVLLQLEQPH